MGRNSERPNRLNEDEIIPKQESNKSLQVINAIAEDVHRRLIGENKLLPQQSTAVHNLSEGLRQVEALCPPHNQEKIKNFWRLAYKLGVNVEPILGSDKLAILGLLHYLDNYNTFVQCVRDTFIFKANISAEHSKGSRVVRSKLILGLAAELATILYQNTSNTEQRIKVINHLTSLLID